MTTLLCMVKVHEYWWHAPTNGYANLRLFAVSNFNPGGYLKVDVFVYHCQGRLFCIVGESERGFGILITFSSGE